MGIIDHRIIVSFGRKAKMVYESEIIMSALGMGVLVYVLVNRHLLRRIPSFKILIVALCALVTGWLMTVLESFFWETVLNFIEHLAYAISAIVLAFWSWKVFVKPQEKIR